MKMTTRDEFFKLIADKIEEGWFPGKGSCEEHYRDSLGFFLEDSFRDFIVDKECPTFGGRCDLFVAEMRPPLPGVLFPNHVVLEVKRLMWTRQHLDKLISQIKGYISLAPTDVLVIFVESAMKYITELRNEFGYLEGANGSRIRIIDKTYRVEKCYERSMTEILPGCEKGEMIRHFSRSDKGIDTLLRELPDMNEKERELLELLKKMPSLETTEGR